MGFRVNSLKNIKKAKERMRTLIDFGLHYFGPKKESHIIPLLLLIFLSDHFPGRKDFSYTLITFLSGFFFTTSFQTSVLKYL